MSVLNKIENAKVELKVTLEGEKWETAKNKSFDKIASKVEIKGFRKGQAPKNLVRKQINEQQVILEAVESLAQEALINAIEEHHVELIDRPELKIDTLTNEKAEITFVCAVKPDVTLGQYKGLGYSVEEATVTDEDVENEISKIKEQKAELEIKEDGSVENGDTVVIDYAGFKDGVAFDGGTAENQELVIGSNTFIPGFEEQLIGMKSEEEKEINVKFPEDYHAEDLKGADAMFKVTVHEIKTKVLPELDEEIISSLNIKDVKTEEELRNYIKDALLKNRQNENENKATDELLDKVCEAATVEIPEVMIENEVTDMLKEYEQRLMQQGLKLEQFYQFTGQTEADLRSNMRIDAEKKVKLRLVLEEVAKAENVEVTKEDINAEYENIANQYGMKTEDVMKYIPEDNISYDLKLRKALEILKA
ncbi:MAG: trigger factor [Erysipelotrichaceae bacterium]|nr:trigger factor [Erysipelotrichaceae bacterium]